MNINQREKSFAAIWWEDLSGPRRFLVDTAKKLSAGKSVVLILPENVPWVDTMRLTLENLLRRGTQSIKVISANEISVEPPKYVLDEFCANKDGFRPFNKKAYAKFLAERTGIALNDTCLWIRDAAVDKVKQWHAFITDYHDALKDRRGGVFLLEATSTFSGGNRHGVELMAYDKNISDYDSFAFNIFTAADFGNENRLMKQYLAELVSALTKGNVEFGSACIAGRKDFLSDPHATFEKILREGNFTTDKTPEDIEQDIWSTQLKLVFPLIENFRRDFIRRYETEIHTATEDLEIGALYKIFNNKRWLLVGNDGDDLELYREARNKLAHLRTLPFDELEKIFDKNSRR